MYSDILVSTSDCPFPAYKLEFGLLGDTLISLASDSIGSLSCLCRQSICDEPIALLLYALYPIRIPFAFISSAIRFSAFPLPALRVQVPDQPYGLRSFHSAQAFSSGRFHFVFPVSCFLCFCLTIL